MICSTGWFPRLPQSSKLNQLLENQSRQDSPDVHVNIATAMIYNCYRFTFALVLPFTSSQDLHQMLMRKAQTSPER